MTNHEYNLADTDKPTADHIWDNQPATNHEVIVNELALSELDCAILHEALKDWANARTQTGEETGYESLTFRAEMLADEVWVWRNVRPALTGATLDSDHYARPDVNDTSRCIQCANPIKAVGTAPNRVARHA